jgi:GTP cyclohydrolase I
VASNYKRDKELGEKVHAHLVECQCETVTQYPLGSEAKKAMEEGLIQFFNFMGLDLTDPSITPSPARISDMMVYELCAGLNYDNFPKCTTSPNVGTNEMVMVDSINTISLCEHHFQSIIGVTHVAYIPGPKLLGLSKFARITDFFARRPQVQERMTEQLWHALELILETEDIAIQQVCTHNCMRVRGVMDPHSKTTTSKLGGRFMTNPALRQEFLHAIPK